MAFCWTVGVQAAAAGLLICPVVVRPLPTVRGCVVGCDCGMYGGCGAANAGVTFNTMLRTIRMMLMSLFGNLFMVIILFAYYSRRRQRLIVG